MIDQIENGKEYIGRRVSKYFGEVLYDGTVKSFRHEKEFCVWMIKYDDGDEEELEEEELNKAMAKHDEDLVTEYQVQMRRTLGKIGLLIV